MMAIGSLDRAGRLDQIGTFARCQVWAGYRAEAEIRREVYDAVLVEEHDPAAAAALTDRLIASARDKLAGASRTWPSPAGFERLQAALVVLRERDIVVLEAIDDHWEAAAELERRATTGTKPRGIAYFTLPDVWHAVEHGMLEINVWHGNSANVAPGDHLLDTVLDTLAAQGISAVFDEGRIEVSLAWQRRGG